MKRIFQGIIMLFLLVTVTSLQAQDRTVTGRILDQENSEPLAGVSVIVKGTSTGTSTDQNGRFSIAVPAGKRQLELSYSGYIQQTITVDRSGPLSINLTR